MTDWVMAYEAMKTALVPPDQDLRALVHVHIGMAIWLGLVLLWRRGMTAILPLVGLIAACLMNEGFDVASHWPVIHDWVWRDTAGDIFNTLLWPVLVWLYACWRERGADCRPPPDDPQD